MKQPTEPGEIQKCADDPYYYYVNYIVPEGKEPMSEEEYRENVKNFVAARDKQYTPEQLEKIRDEKAKHTFGDKSSFVDIVAGQVAKEANPIKNRIKQEKERKEKKKLSNRKKSKAAKKSRRNNRKK